MLFDAPDFDAHEALHVLHDAATGMKAIVALHSTALGPAAGGCRRWAYASDAQAVSDALRLSRGMSYKNAMAGLPMGGGKAVLLADADKTDALLERLGDALESLGGRYVTAEDVGMSERDMTVIARRTAHVAGLPATGGAVGGDPGPHTALGVFLGMRAACRHRLGTDDFAGVRVAVQGLGAVGYALAERLRAAGARLVVADVDPKRTARAAAELGADIAAVEQIHAAPADVYAPCALGATLNAATIPALTAKVVAGAANNQLATDADGQALAERGILYAPDYIINAAGIINVVAEYLGRATPAEVAADIAKIEPRLTDLFAESARTGERPDAVADRRARALIGRG